MFTCEYPSRWFNFVFSSWYDSAKSWSDIYITVALVAVFLYFFSPAWMGHLVNNGVYTFLVPIFIRNPFSLYSFVRIVNPVRTSIAAQESEPLQRVLEYASQICVLDNSAKDVCCQETRPARVWEAQHVYWICMTERERRFTDANQFISLLSTLKDWRGGESADDPQAENKSELIWCSRFKCFLKRVNDGHNIWILKWKISKTSQRTIILLYNAAQL